jgi:hypothetical protein
MIRGSEGEIEALIDAYLATIDSSKVIRAFAAVQVGTSTEFQVVIVVDA